MTDSRMTGRQHTPFPARLRYRRKSDHFPPTQNKYRLEIHEVDIDFVAIIAAIGSDFNSAGQNIQKRINHVWREYILVFPGQDRDPAALNF